MGIILSSGHTPLERCCVHNMSPFVSSSGLSPGSREAKVQRTNVCLNCMEPSVARSSHWSLPVGRYLSDSHYKDRWWSSRGELRAIRPKSCRHLLVTRWESGKQPVVLLTPHLTRGEYMVSLRCCIVPMCQIHQDENAGSLCWPMSYTHTSKLAQCMCDRGVTWFPAWCLTSRSSCPTYSYASPSYANPMQDLPCAATRGVDHASKMTNASTTSTSATWTVELEVEEGTCRILVFDQFIWRLKVDASSCVTVSARTRILWVLWLVWSIMWNKIWNMQWK